MKTAESKKLNIEIKRTYDRFHGEYILCWRDDGTINHYKTQYIVGRTAALAKEKAMRKDAGLI